MEMALEAVEQGLRKLALDEAVNIPRARSQTDHAMLHVLSASASYVTGTHAIKTGVQWGLGPYTTRGDLNGELIQL